MSDTNYTEAARDTSTYSTLSGIVEDDTLVITVRVPMAVGPREAKRVIEKFFVPEYAAKVIDFVPTMLIRAIFAKMEATKA